MSIFRKKKMSAPSSGSGAMKKELKTVDLIMLGIGAVVGTGIFVITGVAANEYAGPALTLSFVIAAIAIILSGLCYAEFSSRVPVIGGPYAYMYVVFGEIIAWMTGWLVICEFFLAVSSVASGWSGYVHGFLDSLGVNLPKAISGAYNSAEGTYIDLIAMLVVVLVTFWVSQEAKTALRLNNIMVFVKFAIIALFVGIGIFYVKPENWQPFMPFGFSGVISGAALVFFAFLGFDSVSMAAEEVKNPQKDIPKGIIGSIIISTILYIVVTLILTGIVPFTQLGVKDPVAFAMRFIQHSTIGGLISVGAILTLLTVTISMMYSLARVIYAISKDGLLPKFMSKIDEKRRTPKNATYVAGLCAMIFAGLVPMELLAELTNIVSLMYLMMMAVGIIKLRKMFGKPKPEEFKVPLVPFLPILSIFICMALMLQLKTATWQIFGVTLVIGLVIYFFYGYKHSLANEELK
ncbi:amino acid permease [Enterococcus rivorum]|uniref:Amino acid permease n=1 Tax=Enterococcus rivorum TaxID=762845 RepID=A0A1E5L1U9_9ENTE|nr:amino acid permease [Enterococcus rivorum]MBP2098705.1 APA family basic amino acid/polyamine antiporter [Enterococcus rivorum]OEH83899.1 amino acid permease [Enterococcus rivorum]